MKKMYRLLSLVLCLAMLCSLAVGASAAEGEYIEVVEGAVSARDMKAIYFEKQQWQYGEEIVEENVYFIDNFADLKLVVSTTEHETYTVIQNNMNPFVIEENFSVPAGCWMSMYDLQIPQGVTLDTDKGGFYAENLTVNGTLNCSHFNAGKKLVVNGTINSTGSINVERGCAITNPQNIKFASEYMRISINYYVTDMATLKQAVADANANKNPLYSHSINIYEKELVINESITIPENCDFYFSMPVTVAQGCTLTMETWMGVDALLTVKGTLVNNEGVGVYPAYGGKLVIENGATYKGKGGLTIGGQGVASPDGAIVGIDLSNYEVSEDKGDYGNYWYYNVKPCDGEHDFGAWEIDEEATCTEAGWKFHECNLCGVRYFEETEALGHAFDDKYDPVCNRCALVRDTQIPANREPMDMYRMYNPNSGEHFYTGSVEERDNLINAGWNYEGVGFTFPRTTGGPVYRLYDRHNTCEHLYTMDEAEKNALIAAGWEIEGVAFNSAYETEVPQYRLHNPNVTIGAYHFTASLTEKNNLIAAGWEYQGIGWYTCGDKNVA